MKKLYLGICLALALCLACGAVLAEDAGLKDARSYVNMMYKNKAASTPKDYQLIGSVPGDGDPYTVEWTTDSDTIRVIREENGMVTIDVDEDNPREVQYVLTATISNAAGETATVSFNRFVPAAINLDILGDEEIVAIAYTLEDGAALPAATALKGVVTAIPTPWSDEYKNITVNIQVGALADQPVQCYRLTGENAAALAVGDEIAVAGLIKNYKGTIEFDKGCVLIPAAEVQSARVAMYAYGLEEGAAMTRPSTMTGVVTEIRSAYSEQYGNITVKIVAAGLDGYTVECYRLKGDGADTLAVGDTVTVSGTIKNYKGTIEFDSGCVIDAIVKGE